MIYIDNPYLKHNCWWPIWHVHAHLS